MLAHLKRNHPIEIMYLQLLERVYHSLLKGTLVRMHAGYLSTVRELLKLPGININATNQDGCTPLHVAAYYGINLFKNVKVLGNQERLG